MRRLARPYAIVGWLAALVGALGAIALRIVDHVLVIPDELGFGDLALVGFEFLDVTFASVPRRAPCGSGATKGPFGGPP